MRDADSPPVRYLVLMSKEAFNAIPDKAVPRTVRIDDPTLESPQAIEHIVSGYCEKLIFKNEKLQELLQNITHAADDPAWRDHLTQGQRMLHAIAALDGQVQNGGLTQFFWNRAELVFEVSDALNVLGPTELAEAYDQALEGLVGKKDEWGELRKRSLRDPHNPAWEPFQKSYDLLDLGWFDDAYFNQFGYDDAGQYVLQNPGLGATMLKRLVDYVKTHQDEFIET